MKNKIEELIEKAEKYYLLKSVLTFEKKYARNSPNYTGNIISEFLNKKIDKVKIKIKNNKEFENKLIKEYLHDELKKLIKKENITIEDIFFEDEKLKDFKEYNIIIKELKKEINKYSMNTNDEDFYKEQKSYFDFDEETPRRIIFEEQYLNVLIDLNENNLYDEDNFIKYDKLKKLKIN